MSEKKKEARKIIKWLLSIDDDKTCFLSARTAVSKEARDNTDDHYLHDADVETGQKLRDRLMEIRKKHGAEIKEWVTETEGNQDG